jgi:hypothetical protein
VDEAPDQTTTTTTYTNVSTLFNIGPQFLIKNIIAIDPCFGIGYGRTKGNETSSYTHFGKVYTKNSEFKYGGLRVSFMILVGIAFGK